MQVLQKIAVTRKKNSWNIFDWFLCTEIFITLLLLQGLKTLFYHVLRNSNLFYFAFLLYMLLDGFCSLLESLAFTRIRVRI